VRVDANFASVDVKLDIDRKYAPIGKDASAAIVAQNILGQKQVRLDVGDAAGEPGAGGLRDPSRRTRASTDLDQLLSTLDADTRTRLAIVVNELGTAFAGRKLDFRTFVHERRAGVGVGARRPRRARAGRQGARHARGQQRPRRRVTCRLARADLPGDRPPRRHDRNRRGAPR